MSSALLKTPLRQVSNVKDLLMNESARDQLSMVAAKHLNPERMMRTVANAIRTTPKLGQCEPISFLGALMQVAALGLEPNTVMGHAYLIPFENKRKNVTEVQVVIGYRGLMDLAMRSDRVKRISAHIHYSDDEKWVYEEGTLAQLRHVAGPEEGQKLHAYAIAELTNGGFAYVVLPWKRVLKIRDASQGWQTAVKFNTTAKSPWHTHEDAMAMKTAIRALSKYLPLSVEFADALAVDEKQADYRGFAMDPTAGVTIEGEADEADVSADAETAPAVEAQKVEPTKQAKPAPKAEPAKQDAPAQASMLDDAETKQPEAVAESEPDWSTNGFARGFLNDVADMGFDAAADLNGQQLDEVKDQKPGLHAYIMAEVARRENQSAN